MSTHPAPHRHRVGRIELAFALTGSTIAWAVQFGAGFAFTSMSCFAAGERVVEPFGSARAVAAWISVACLLLSLGSTLVASLIWRRTRDEVEGDEADLVEKGAGRTRFLAFWGLLLGIGAIATIGANLIGVLMVPSCVG